MRLNFTGHSVPNRVHSVLDEIPGVGPARRKALMRHFRSIEEIRAAEVEELLAVDGMNRPAAERIYQFFRKEKSSEQNL